MDFYQVCTNYPPGAKMGHMFYIGLYREKHEKTLSDTTRPRALIFGMKHHLVNNYQVCSNNGPGPKIVWPPGSHVLHRLIQGTT